MKTCPKCGRAVDDSAQFCPTCGYPFGATQYRPCDSVVSDNAFDPCGPEGKVRGIAALFAILLGSIGVQYFYLGKISAGIITILLTIVTCGLWEIVMLIQGVLMFCMSNQEFRQKYVLSNSALPLF